MPRNSEYVSYTFIRSELENLGWNPRNPNRDPDGEIFTQQECLDHPDLGPYLKRSWPEYIIKIREGIFWVTQAKADHQQLDLALREARDYAEAINANPAAVAFIVTGVAGSDIDGYWIETGVVHPGGTFEPVTYNGRPITGFLSPDQARYLTDHRTAKLNDLTVSEKQLLKIAEDINEMFHSASINKDQRATVIAAILLSMVSDTIPNFSASPDVLIRDMNNRAEDVLIEYSKREFAEQIELKLPLEDSAKAKYKQALVKAYALLRRINIKAAMNGGTDILGKFYEVFLKYGNGAKDIGIVLTPRHMTEFACDVLQVTHEDIVYDPTCGTGGFLVAAYDKVRQTAEPQEIEPFKKHRIFGVEQQSNVAALAIVNMIFRGDGKNNIMSGNCFSIRLNRKIRNGQHSAEFVKDIEEPSRPPVTKVLMNPPFALKKEDEQEHVFVQHALGQMARNGLLFAVLPTSVMFSSGKDHTFRKQLLEQHTLCSVISFPNELFYPSASVETLAIIVRSGVPHNFDRPVLWARLTDDGYRKIKRKRLPSAEGSPQFNSYRTIMRKFIDTGSTAEDLPGYCQGKPIDRRDKSLELIPQAYLDNPPVTAEEIQNELKNMYTEITFQKIREGLNR